MASVSRGRGEQQEVSKKDHRARTMDCTLTSLRICSGGENNSKAAPCRRRRFFAKRSEAHQPLPPNSSHHHQVTVNNVRIKFPFVPYPAQEDFMSACIQALSNGENALLESPTGTGKTLSLLCATLAWRETFRLKPPGVVASTDNSFQIIYASRTHAQLAQAVAELRRTSYGAAAELIVAVLGSREQFCVNPSVLRARQKSATVLNHKCKQAVKNQTCFPYHSFTKLARDNPLALATAVDVEDLVNNRLQRSVVCPFHTMRQLAKYADVVFMPYAYLLDLVTQARSKTFFNLENAIVIIDEGHNIAQTCETAASFEFYLGDFTTVAEQMQLLVIVPDGLGQHDRKSMQICQQHLNNMHYQLGLLSCTTLYPPTPLSLKDLMTCVRQAGLSYRNISAVFQALKFILRRNEEAADKDDESNSGSGDPTPTTSSSSPSFAPVCSLERVKRLLSTLFFPHCDEKSRRSCEFATDAECAKEEAAARQHYSPFLVTITEVMSSKQHVNPLQRRGQKRAADSDKLFTCLCMSPYQPLRSLVQSKIRSLIVTSGTLSPMDVLACELGIPFNVRLACRHVIDSRQIRGLMLSHVPRGVWGLDRRWNNARQLVPLQADFKHRDSKNFVGALGGAILKFLQCIPAGVLVFFPSYVAMTNCLRQWTALNCLAEMALVKTVFVEDRDRNKFRTDLADFRQTVRGLSNRLQNPHNNNPNSRLTGAVLFAVCRGKVAEGIDFPDDCARGVIVIGIPFGNVMDERVILKRHFLNQRNQTASAAGGLTFTSRACYEREAWVAVNQALGRVIRHRYDYGVCIMLDERFLEEYERVQRQMRGPHAIGHAVKESKLPRYLNESVRPYTFEAALEELKQFFSTNCNPPSWNVGSTMVPSQAVNENFVDPDDADHLATIMEIDEVVPAASNSNLPRATVTDDNEVVEDDGFSPPRTGPAVLNKRQRLATVTENFNENDIAVTAARLSPQQMQQVAVLTRPAKTTPAVSSSGSSGNSNGLNTAFVETPISVRKITVNAASSTQILPNFDDPVASDAVDDQGFADDSVGKRKLSLAAADDDNNKAATKRRKRRKRNKAVVLSSEKLSGCIQDAQYALEEARKIARCNIVPERRAWFHNRRIATDKDLERGSEAPPLRVSKPNLSKPMRPQQQRKLSRKQQHDDSRKCVEQALAWAEAMDVQKEKFEASQHIHFGEALMFLQSELSGKTKCCGSGTAQQPVTVANIAYAGAAPQTTNNSEFEITRKVMPLATSVEYNMFVDCDDSSVAQESQLIKMSDAEAVPRVNDIVISCDTIKSMPMNNVVEDMFAACIDIRLPYRGRSSRNDTNASKILPTIDKADGVGDIAQTFDEETKVIGKSVAVAPTVVVNPTIEENRIPAATNSNWLGSWWRKLASVVKR